MHLKGIYIQNRPTKNSHNSTTKIYLKKKNTSKKKNWERRPNIFPQYTDGQQTHERMINIAHHQRNAHQNHNEMISPHLKEWLSPKRQRMTSTGEDVEKRKPSCTFVGNIHCYSHCGKQYEGSSKN